MYYFVLRSGNYITDGNANQIFKNGSLGTNAVATNISFLIEVRMDGDCYLSCLVLGLHVCTYISYVQCAFRFIFLTFILVLEIDHTTRRVCYCQCSEY